MKAELMYGGILKPERHSLRQRFQNDDDITILVGVSKSMGTGVTLTRAIFSVLTEQMGDAGTMEQVKGRAARKGSIHWEGNVGF